MCVAMGLLAGLRNRRTLGELSVELSSARTRVQVLEEMAAGMLACVQALVLDIEEIGAPELQRSLAGLAGRLQAGDDPDAIGDDLARCRRDTLDFAEAERRHLETRDAELRQIISVLTEGLATVSSGAAAYHRRLLDNGARFEAAARLSDLVKMRSTITSEVGALRTAVAERKQAEAQATAVLHGEIERLRAKVESATHAASVDPLTQAANRAAFDQAIARRCELAAAGGEGFALLLADIDHFKKINDTHGHRTGDRVLHALVTFLRDRVRRDDLIARWGGEEFAVLLMGAGARPAHAKAKALVGQLEDCDWTIDAADDARKLKFTMSIGVTAFQPDDTPETMVERADRALYAAKHGGRNRAVKS
jgi:diguanylate cyclase